MATAQIKRLKAEPGYFVIRLRYNELGQRFGMDREPVIHWYCDHDWAPVPITPTGAKDGGNVAILWPNGIVVQGHKKYSSLDDWFGKYHRVIDDEPQCAIIGWGDAQPGDRLLEGWFDDDSDPSRYDYQMTPVIKFAIGGNGTVYPVTARDHIVWDYITLVRPDGTVHGYDETWPSADAWAADKLKYELQVKAGRAARAAKKDAA